MRQRITYIILLLPVLVRAQFADHIEESVNGEPHLFGQVDTRHSFIESSYVKFIGLQLGVESGRFRTGVGYSWIINPGTKRVQITNAENPGSYLMKFRYRYAFVQVEYTILNQLPWRISIPLRIGVGKAFEHYIRQTDGLIVDYKSAAQSLEIAIIADYRFLNYFGAGIGLGYRLGAIKEDYFITKLNSPIYMARLNFYMGDWFRTMTSD